MSQLRRILPWIVAVEVVVALYFVKWPLGVFPLYEKVECQNQSQTGEKYCTSIDVVLFFLGHISKFLEDYDEAIVAAATLAISAFTFTLWRATSGLKRSTDRLWKAGERQIKVAEDAVQVAAASANAAIVAAHATQQSVIKMDEAMNRQLRAYVIVQAGNFIEQNLEKGIDFEFQPIVKNTGQTPAREMWHVAVADVLSHPLPVVFDFSLVDPLTQSVSVLGKDEDEHLFIHLGRYLTEKELYAIRHENSVRLYIYGTIAYEDVFEAPHHTNFCRYIEWGPEGDTFWMKIDRHNDAD